MPVPPDYWDSPAEDLSKPWWQSTGVLGGLGSVATGLAGLLYPPLAGIPFTVEVLGASISAIMTGGLAVYGRVSASKRIEKRLL